MSKHTLGPWRVVNGVQIRSERHQIAKVWMMRDGEGKANAHLIAAAPELLEALETILSTEPVHGLNPEAKMSDPMDVKIGWNVHAIARAALAKAKGE